MGPPARVRSGHRAVRQRLAPALWSGGPRPQEGSRMPAVIQTEQLTKSYGAHRGIVDVDLEVQQGEVFGFLGPNGAGKTTTLRTLLDLIRPTRGRAWVFDIETTVDPVAR